MFFLIDFSYNRGWVFMPDFPSVIPAQAGIQKFEITAVLKCS